VLKGLPETWSGVGRSIRCDLEAKTFITMVCDLLLLSLFTSCFRLRNRRSFFRALLKGVSFNSYQNAQRGVQLAACSDTDPANTVARRR
jgi:hypothetical protein